MSSDDEERQRSASVSVAAERVHARYAPQGHEHPPGKFVSASLLINISAEDYAKQLLRWVNDGVWNDSDIDPYWSFKGNTLADEALADFPSTEIRVDYPLEDEWVLRGHLDGIKTVGNRVVVAEHKAHVHPDGWKEEKALRQGALYLAMARHIHRALMDDTWNGDNAFEKVRLSEDRYASRFPLAPWAPPGSKPFAWRDDAEAGGVLVCIAPAYPPPIVNEHPMTDDNLDEILRLYANKAKTIVSAVENNNLAIARAWDQSETGLKEFARKWEEYEEDFDIEALASEYDDIRSALKELERKKDAVKKELLLKVRGGDDYESERFKVTHVRQAGRTYADVSALEAEGMTEFLRTSGPREWVRVTKKGDGGGE